MKKGYSAISDAAILFSTLKLSKKAHFMEKKEVLPE
jgi:hypothetical protein